MMMVFLLSGPAAPALAAFCCTGARAGALLGVAAGVTGRPMIFCASGAGAAGPGAGAGAPAPVLICCISTISTFSRFRPA